MRLSHLPAAFAVALALSSCQTTYMNEPLDDAAGIAAAKSAFLAAWTKQPGAEFTLDKLELAVDTSEHFVSFDAMSPQQSVITGYKTYVAIWVPGMKDVASAALTEKRPVATWIGDDTALTASIVHVQGQTADGQPIEIVGHLTLGYQRHDGGWRVVHEHMSTGVKE
jgi:ketosteroid isomerase-like protein